MTRSLVRIPLVKDLPPEVLKAIAGCSAGTQFTSTLTSQVTEFYKTISGKSPHNYHYEQNPCWEPALRANVYFWGSIDSAIGGAGTFIGFMTSFHELFGTDIYNPYVMGAAVASAAGTTVMTFIFTTYNGYDKTYTLNIHAGENPIVMDPPSQPINLGASSDNVIVPFSAPQSTASVAAPHTTYSTPTTDSTSIYDENRKDPNSSASRSIESRPRLSEIRRYNGLGMSKSLPVGTKSINPTGPTTVDDMTEILGL